MTGWPTHSAEARIAPRRQAQPTAPAELAQAIENTLIFAGEHTDITGHPGTVHGALRSGLRAAQQVLALS